jgi:CDP-6-deoxy-D-xylo-4-hexulose-3-dehydrase
LTSPKLGDRAIKRGDEVITVAAGFPTTVTPILQFGAVPVFVDVALPGFDIDVTQLEAAYSPKVKAVDSTGAGDTFNATLAVRLVEGEVLSKACYDANIEAAKSVGIRFVMPALPHRGS